MTERTRWQAGCCTVPVHPRARIDVAQVLDVLRECARDRQVRRSVEVEGSTQSPPRLAIAALARLGLTPRDFDVAPIVSEHAADFLPSAAAFTIGAVIALRAADRAERRGSDWAQALGAARRDVLRLLTVVPPSVLMPPRGLRRDESTGIATDG